MINDCNINPILLSIQYTMWDTPSACLEMCSMLAFDVIFIQTTVEVDFNLVE